MCVSFVYVSVVYVYMYMLYVVFVCVCFVCIWFVFSMYYARVAFGVYIMCTVWVCFVCMLYVLWICVYVWYTLWKWSRVVQDEITVHWCFCCCCCLKTWYVDKPEGLLACTHNYCLCLSSGPTFWVSPACPPTTHTVQSHLPMRPLKTVPMPAINNMEAFSLYPALCLSWAILLEKETAFVLSESWSLMFV